MLEDDDPVNQVERAFQAPSDLTKETLVILRSRQLRAACAIIASETLTLTARPAIPNDDRQIRLIDRDRGRCGRDTQVSRRIHLVYQRSLGSGRDDKLICSRRRDERSRRPGCPEADFIVIEIECQTLISYQRHAAKR